MRDYYKHTTMGYKWRPSASQKIAFAERMKNPDEVIAYEAKKCERANKRRSKSKFDYNKAGGNYVPTKEQHDFCLVNSHLFESRDEEMAMNEVLRGYSCNDKVHHDYIHIVNEKRRNNT